MKKLFVLFPIMFMTCLLVAQQGTQSTISFKMEELSSPQYVRAVVQAGNVCVVPLGIIEKHGPHLPIGTDLIVAREIAFRAAEKEYVLIFPPYYVGQIFEAKHQPGTIAYSNELMWKMLEETCNELSRNGIKKIILLNGHGGNNSFLTYFCQSQLMSPKDYVVVLFQTGTDPVADKEIRSLKKTKTDGHAGEEETSMFLFVRPDFNNIDAAKNESGDDQARLSKMPFGYTGIWWYAKFPNHYAGDGSQADKRLGELEVNKSVTQLTELIRFLKKDNTVRQLQDQFFKKAQNPLEK
jgi:creatinine amidohydrolase